MKKNKLLFLLSAVFILLLIIWMLLSAWNNNQAEKAITDAEAEIIAVTNIDRLSSLAYENGSGSLAFEAEDGLWHYSADKSIPIRQSYVDTLSDSLCHINASRRIDDPDPAGDYGLDIPSHTIRMNDTSGNSYTITIGDSIDGECYLMLNEDPETIYTISTSLTDSMDYTLDSAVEKDTLPAISSSNLQTVTIKANGGMHSYSSESSDSQEDIAVLLGGYGAISLTQCTSYHVNDDEKAQFGLTDTGRTTVTLTFTDSDEQTQTFTIYVGAADDSGENRYVQVQDSQMVYLVSAETIQNLLTEND